MRRPAFLTMVQIADFLERSDWPHFRRLHWARLRCVIAEREVRIYVRRSSSWAKRTSISSASSTAQCLIHQNRGKLLLTNQTRGAAAVQGRFVIILLRLVVLRILQ